MILSQVRVRALRQVEREGRAKRGGQANREAGLTEFLWKLADGRLLGDAQINQHDDWYDFMQGAHCVGQRLTDAGRRALAEAEGE